MAISLLICAAKACALSSVSKRRRRSRPSGPRQITCGFPARSVLGFTTTCWLRFLAISAVRPAARPFLEVPLHRLQDDLFHAFPPAGGLDLELDPHVLRQVDGRSLAGPAASAD